MTIVLFSFFSIFLVIYPPPLKAQELRKPLTIGETFSGEELHYEIDFWIIRGIAEVVLSFSRTNERGKYAITLKGNTKGVLGSAIRQREDYYRAISEEVDDGRKLRTFHYEEYVKVGSKTRKNVHFFDHQKRKWVHKYFRDGRERRQIVREIPDKAEYNDFLTAAYNFRYGVYGSITSGGLYHVPVFPRKNVTHYEVRVLSSRNPESLEGKHFFVELKVDPEIINSSQGLIEGWLSADLYPIEGIIRDVLFFGDVRGRLIKRVKKSD